MKDEKYCDVLKATTLLRTLIRTKEKIIEMLQQSINETVSDELYALNKSVQKALILVVKNIRLLM